MKTKHTVAYIKSSSVWSKILCALMAVALLSLMVPSGLCAYADEPVVNQNSNEKATDLLTEGVNNNEVSANSFWTLNSDATFIPTSVNAAETAGHFTVQTAECSLGEVLKNSGMAIQDIKTMDELYDAIIGASPSGGGGNWLNGLLSGYTEEQTTVNVSIDLKDALIIPDDAYKQLSKDSASNPYNKFIFYEDGGVTPIENFHRASDGSLYFIWFTLGEGDIFDMINHGLAHAKRIVPNMPAFNNKPFVDKALMGSNLQAENNNTVARFLNWEVSLDGTNYIPVDMLLESLEQGYLEIYPWTHYYFKANFYDMEGMTLVHLNFSDANTLSSGPIENLTDNDEGVSLESKLRADGWYTTDTLRGSVWTIALPNWMPKWLVYSYIFENYGESIFEKGEVYKDSKLRARYFDQQEQERVTNDGFVYPNPGPHWVEFSDPSWEGTLDSETTITFSWYPISPMGHVFHSYPYNPFESNNFAENGGTPNPQTETKGDFVPNASVMLYDANGWPLFDFRDAHYGEELLDISDLKYGFVHNPGGVDSHLDYCWDEQVDYAIVYAWGSEEKPGIYVPLRAEVKDFNPRAQLLWDYGYSDFQVERMMFGDLESAWFNSGVESYNVTYLEDGQPLFDTFTISNPWEIAMFGLPLVTNGTITTWRNTLVSGWNGYVHWAAPFGHVDPLNAFKDQNNFEASNGNHWFQVRIEANVKAGYAFDSWRYDFAKFSADVEGAGENPIIVEEPILLDNHIIGAATTKVAAAEAADVEIVNPATANADGNVALASENAPAIASNTDGSAQTGDSASVACAIIAMLALAGCGIFAGRKLYSK